MKPEKRNAILAVIGLVSLLGYILACASFSPDDSKILYPSFDAASSRLGVALYDRKSKRSEMIFLPMLSGAGSTNATHCIKEGMMRPQWRADGKRVLVSWQMDKELLIAVMPLNGRGAFTVYADFLKGSAPSETLLGPLPVVGERAFILESANSVVRLDLNTGAVVRHEFHQRGMSLWPMPAESGIFYMSDGETREFGRLDPETFATQPLMTFTNQLADGPLFGYDPTGKRLAIVEGGKSGQRVLLLENGKSVFSRPVLEPGGELKLGNLLFGRKSDTLLGSYQFTKAGETNSSFGLIEIPLTDAPMRRTVLIQSIAAKNDLSPLYMEMALSHDGKTAAASSTYLATGPEMQGADCALFMVDLTSAKRKVTTVPIPLPSLRPCDN